MDINKLGLRHEDYLDLLSTNPFLINSNIYRDSKIHSSDMNWHDSIELQWIKKGEGFAILDNLKKPIKANDIILVNSNEMHYTGSKTFVTYSCIIIGTSFLSDLNLGEIKFVSFINDSRLLLLLNNLENNEQSNNPYKNIISKKILLEIIFLLCENYINPNYNANKNTSSFQNVKATILYIRMHYANKISLEDLSKNVSKDKYCLVKEFKKITGMSIFNYLNDFRCKKAKLLITEGCSISEAAYQCGFNNLPYFIKTYKKYIGELPSKTKKKCSITQ